MNINPQAVRVQNIPTIYSRLYDRFSDLIPKLQELSEGDAFYAESRIPGDMSIYCDVTKVNDFVVEIEITDDRGVHLEFKPAPWMVFRINNEDRTAELLSVQEKFTYEVIFSKSNQHNPRRGPMNLYAVNWLTILYGIQKTFQAIPANAVA